MIRLKESRPDFIGKFCSEADFPISAFTFGEVQKEEMLNKLYKVGVESLTSYVHEKRYCGI